MRKFARLVVVAGAAVPLLAAGLTGGSVVVGAGASAATMSLGQAVAAAGVTTPRWVLHVQRYPGGFSAGVRMRATNQSAGDPAAYANAAVPAPPSVADLQRLHNVQMDTNSNPPLPQNETNVAVSLDHPNVAVAASNDYVTGGNTVMYTSDGGHSWGTIRVNPVFDGTRDYCTGGDPWLAYSLRDKAFYMVQLCFFRSLAFSEVQLYKSIDDGHTWTPGRQSALAAGNFDYSTGTVDTSIFEDNNQVVVDNNLQSPHYGRIYVTHVKFHTLASGFSDYCPVQLSYTDDVPTFNPRLTVFTQVPVVPDQPGGPGVGRSANQWPRPQVQQDGTLDIAYALEDCNSGLDRHFEMQKSTNGGASFLKKAVQIDHPGEFVDNPDLGDVLPPTTFRAPASPGFRYNSANGMLGFAYQNGLDRKTSGANISFEQSADGGLTWTPMKYISITSGGQPAPHDQFFPSLTNLADGTWAAIWYDRRNDPANTNIETFQGMSNDGVTWTDQDISTTPWNPNLSYFRSGAFIGDYLGVDASTTRIYPAWADGRTTQIRNTGIGNTDIFTNVESVP
jgi:hypothetical protein